MRNIFKQKFLALVLTIAALAVGHSTASAGTTYTVSGGTGNTNAEFYAQFTYGSTMSNQVNWTYNTTAEISFNLRTNITLTLSNTNKQLVIRDNATGDAIGGQGATTLTVSGNDYYYIYRVRLLTADGNVIQLNANGQAVNQGGVSECDYWNMTKSFSQTYTNGILFSKIEVSYATAIPITDAVISGISSSYPVSNAAITPEPTVTWHGTTLTKDTHYTLSYQNNTSAGTANVKATGKGKFSTSTSVSKNYTLVWATYSVRFNKNSDSADGTMGDQAFTYATAQNLTANAFTRTGYTFDHWTTNADGSGDSYTDGQSVTNLTPNDGGTFNLYAQWTDLWGIADGANGSEGHPYIITTTDGLDLLAKMVNGTDGYTANNFDGKFFKLGANITYSYEGLGTDESNFTAIGGYINGNIRYFRGIFDGDGYTVSGIRIRKGSDNYQGLFGMVSGGTIKNVTLTDADITGKQEVGGIAGYIDLSNNTDGIIENCHVTSSVAIHAVADYASYHGGIVGRVNGGNVSGCTSTATLTVAEGLTGCDTYGGIVGDGYGNLENNLVVGANVSGNSPVGAIAGYKNDSHTYTANYYRSCTVNGTANATGVGVGYEGNVSTPHDIDGVRSVHTLTLPTDVTATGESVEISGITYYASNTNVTFTYNGSIPRGYVLDIKVKDAGNNDIAVTESNDTYTFTMPASDATVTAMFTYPWIGDGTADDPYQISNYAELKAFATVVNGTYGEANPNACAKLVDDIVCKNSSDYMEYATDWVPIGNASRPYTGTFDGKDNDGQIHTITGLSTPNNNSSDYVGLFGYIGSYGVVKDVILEYATTTGNSNVGVVAGYNNGTLTDNYYISCSANDATANIGTGSGDCDGARGLYTITLPTDVTATGESVEISGITYYAASATVTLAYSGSLPADCLYSVNGESIAGNTFTMPAEDVTVTAALTDVWGVTNDADGSEGHPYIITTTDGLDLLAKMVNGTDGYTANNFDGKFFKLGANITYSYEGLGTDESNFTAIGGSINGYYRSFRGIFDGDGYTVSGIRIRKGSDNNQGLFGYVIGGTIKNVTLTDADITGKQEVGGIAGYIALSNNTGGIIENCHVTSSVAIHAVANNAYRHGGIVGSVNGGNVSGCTSAATLTVAEGLTGCYNYGGIVGDGYGNLENNLVVGANVSGNSPVGAVVGYKNDSHTYTANYYRSCTVNGTANATGVGVGYEGNVSTPHDIDGVRSVHTLTLPTDVTATGESVEISGITYYASNTTVTLSYSGEVPEGYRVCYTVKDASDNDVTVNKDNGEYTFIMPASDATVSATTKENLWETGSCTIATWEGNRKGAVTFTFDDGAPSQVSYAGPLFNNYGYKATFFLVVNWNPDWSGFQDLADKGHEIGSHSNSHGNNMSGEEALSKQNINGKINQPYGCITVAYPNGNVPSESAVMQNYIAGRIFNGSWAGMPDIMGKDGPSNWARCPALMTGSEGSVKTTNDFTGKMQQAVNSEGWVMFVTHGFQGKNNGNATYSPTDLGAIEGALEWAQNHDDDIWVTTFRNGVMYVKERKASSFTLTDEEKNRLTFTLTHSIADDVCPYDYPLTLCLTVEQDEGYDYVITQNGKVIDDVTTDGTTFMFQAIPNGGNIVLTRTLRMDLADNADNTSVINDHNGEIADVTLQGRTLYKDGAWNTLCLPFDVSIADGPLSGDDVQAMTLNTTTSGVSGKKLTLHFDEVSPSGEQGGLIPAGTPFIIKWAEGDNMESPVFTSVTIDNSASTEVSFTGGKFVGTYASTTFNNEDKSILFLGASNKLYYPVSGARIGAFRAYFQLDNSVEVKEVVLSFGDEETSLNRPTPDPSLNGGGWYDLSGRRIESPKKRGVFIRNGKKVAIK